MKTTRLFQLENQMVMVYIKIKGKTLDDCMWIDIAYVKEDPSIQSETPYALMAEEKNYKN